MPRTKTFPVRFTQEELDLLSYIVGHYGHANQPRFVGAQKDLQEGILHKCLQAAFANENEEAPTNQLADFNHKEPTIQ